MITATQTDHDQRDSRPAWRRLAFGVVIGTIGSVGMWSFVVALSAVQASFGISRAEAVLPYAMSMGGFAFGGVVMGRLCDRLGLVTPLLIGAICLGTGYIGSSLATHVLIYALMQALVGFGASASFVPIMADLSHWFVKYRGIAVAIASCGNYLAGTIWPPLLHRGIEHLGWRDTHLIAGLVCLATLVPLAGLMRTKLAARTSADLHDDQDAPASNMSERLLLILLVIAGFACCVAMSMPQVHIVAYCADLGYGPARGAEMLSIMLGLGVISRLTSGLIADKIGGLRTLLIGSGLQGVALLLYFFYNDLVSLYVISGLFGLFQGGIVPMYAVITREYFPASRVGSLVGIIIMATLIGMAAGGWMSGFIFDMTGQYRMAFLNGLAWNFVNIAICVTLIIRAAKPRLQLGSAR